MKKVTVKKKGPQSVAIESEFIKLQSLLKLLNIAPSGGAAKQMILDGLVFINSEPCCMRGKKIYPGMRVKVLGYGEFIVTCI